MNGTDWSWSHPDCSDSHRYGRSASGVLGAYFGFLFAALCAGMVVLVIAAATSGCGSTIANGLPDPVPAEPTVPSSNSDNPSRNAADSAIVRRFRQHDETIMESRRRINDLMIEVAELKTALNVTTTTDALKRAADREVRHNFTKETEP